MSKLDELQLRYRTAIERMQAGVAFMMPHSPSETNGKHLRVGINSALVDASSVGVLLVRKGLVTEEEYWEAIAAGMEGEAARYEARVRERYGPNVTLGGTLDTVERRAKAEDDKGD
jgi:hypothetical protein